MADDNEALLDVVAGALPPLLTALEVLGRVSRHLHPPQLEALVGAAEPYAEPLAAAHASVAAQAWPEHLQRFGAALESATALAQRSFSGLLESSSHSQPVMAAYAALRFLSRANEALYPVSAMLPPVSRFFLTDEAQGDADLLAKIDAADPSREEVGILHANNDSQERGGFSLYVPEYYNGAPMPLVVALHGGSGHGRGFLWSWLRAARSQGALLLSPTSQDRTWSLMGDDVDGQALAAMLGYVRERWNVRDDRVLLTGMSDGGTYSYVAGLQDEAPYTHLAPVAASFHPMLTQVASAERLAGLPIYVTHGALDWMFPVDVAEQAEMALAAAGARVTLDVIDDLSHTYPEAHSAQLLRWMMADA